MFYPENNRFLVRRDHHRALLPVGVDATAVAPASATPPVVITSDNDPYPPEGLDAYGKFYSDAFGFQHHVMLRPAHVSSNERHGAWSTMLQWCLTGSSDGEVDHPKIPGLEGTCR